MNMWNKTEKSAVLLSRLKDLLKILSSCVDMKMQPIFSSKKLQPYKVMLTK